jgi:hypothetical protein
MSFDFVGKGVGLSIIVPKTFLGKNSRDTILHKVKDQACYKSGIMSQNISFNVTFTHLGISEESIEGDYSVLRKSICFPFIIA